jgi:hypothetical protein
MINMKKYIFFLLIAAYGCKLPDMYHYNDIGGISSENIFLRTKSSSAYNYNGICNIVVEIKNIGHAPAKISFENTYIINNNLDTIFLSKLFQKDVDIPSHNQFVILPQSDTIIGLVFQGSKNSYRENLALKLKVSNYIDTIIYVKGHKQGYY